MRVTGLGRLLLAASFAVLGTLSIRFHNFFISWTPMPKGIAGHDGLAIVSGVLLLAGAIALAVPRVARMPALVLAGYQLIGVLLFEVPPVAAHPLIEGTWYGVSENLMLVAGLWTVFSLLPHDGKALANLGSVRAGQILFGLALPAIGLSHFFYVGLTTPLIPAWLPFHLGLAYLTGAAHFAAGIAILFGVLPRLAATLEAVMTSLFTLLVWVPIVIAAPGVRNNWSEIGVSIAINGAAWAVAESFRDRPWGFARSR